jgi:hemerythrin-like domain-containing protein
MEATDILMDEHRVILRVLTALDKAANRLEAGEIVPPAFFIEAADFAKGFADGCHHMKEEGVLFPAMAAAGLSMQSGPLAVMLAEHEEGRRLVRGMRQAAERLQGGDTTAGQEVVSNAHGYANLLEAHINKENKILFPLADKIIPAEQRPHLHEEFERIENEETGEGVHEKYLGLAEKLEKAAQG